MQGNGLRIAYLEWDGAGAGDTLVLLHGITGRAFDWAPTVDRLLLLPGASFARVIALDARGHGASDWDPGEAYAGDAHFADLACSLDELGVTSCVLAGFSMGGGVAIMAAASLPERCRSLVVVDTYPGPRMTPGSLGIARTLAHWWDRLSVGGETSAVAPWASAPFDPAIAHSFARDLAAGDARRLDLWPFWEALECPVVLVRGAESTVLPADVAEEMLRRQARARLVTIPGVAHAIPWAAPGALASALAGAGAGSTPDRRS